MGPQTQPTNLLTRGSVSKAKLILSQSWCLSLQNLEFDIFAKNFIYSLTIRIYYNQTLVLYMCLILLLRMSLRMGISQKKKVLLYFVC
jgi:hypothetical protein